MRWLAALLIGLALAGCLGGSGTTSSPPPQVSQTAVAYQADGTGATAVALPAAFQGFQVSTIDTGFHGAEPNIGISPKGTVFVSAYEQVLRSTDGTSWDSVHEVQGGQSFDPMLWVDTTTGRVLYVHIFPQRTCNILATSDDDGTTWQENPLVCPSAIVDHEKLTTGPSAGPLAALADNLNGGRLTLLCYNQSGTTWCAASPDGGQSFPQAVRLDGPGSNLPVIGGLAGQLLGDCGGLNGHQHQAADGTIYVPYGYACQASRIAVSTDGGLTWTRRDPKQGELELDPELATTPDGTAYYLYRGPDQAVHLLRSHDRFATFEGPFLVSPPFLKGTVFAGLTAGADGRIAYAFLGTRESDAGPDDASAATEWHLFAGMSLDAESDAPTFVTTQVTQHPVQRGSICHSKECHDGNRNLLDFIDLSAGPDGRFWVAYTDGCTNEECRLPDQLNEQTSRDDIVAVAHLAAGPSLFGGQVTG